MKTLNGIEMWGVAKSKDYSGVCCIYSDKKDAVHAMDSKWDVLVRMEVTGTFIRPNEFQELK